eukprot:GILI01013924.1.p1 GENE.GILI01013924.1~~GILI01013924.1.p1  ORF type:complete len:462 (+),score=52.99 GILI01013924.1:42-1388(+)
MSDPPTAPASASLQSNFSEEVKEYLSKSWALADSYDATLTALACPPIFTTLRVNTLRTSPQDALESLRQFLAASTASQSNGPAFEPFVHPLLNDLIMICGHVPSPPPSRIYPEVVVDRMCGEAVLRGAVIYAPGVLAAAPGLQVGDSVSIVSALSNKGLTRGAVLTEPFQNGVFVGNGVMTMSRSQVFRESQGCGVAVNQPLFHLPSLNDLMPDIFFPQNLPSVLVSHILQPVPGETILDMCAAPGGKTTHVATLMQNRGRVVALDRSGVKINIIKENASRLGITIIEAYKGDSSKACTSDTSSPDFNTSQFLPNSFDRVLLDPPCSALGLRPRLLQTCTAKELDHFADYQRVLLRTAAKLVKPGGVLVYSTCTITRPENEENVRFAIDNLPLKLVPCEPSISESAAKAADSTLTDAEKRMVQRFDPSGPEDCNGFFIARFMKLPSSE